MSEIKKYKQYIYKDGEYRKVSGGSGEPEPTPVESGKTFSDIQIKSIYFKNEDSEGNKGYSDLENLMSESNNPENIKICFETTPIDDKFEEEINNGKAIIRFDYPLRHKSSKITKSGAGHKGFARNLYSTDRNSLQKIIPNKYKNEMARSFVFLTTNDIKTNEYGEKYIYKEMNMIDFSNKLGNIVTIEPGINRAEKQFDENVVENYYSIFSSDEEDRRRFNGEQVGLWGLEGYPLLCNSTKNYDFSFYSFFAKNEVTNSDRTGKSFRIFARTNKNYRVFFPLFIKLYLTNPEEGSFEYYFNLNDHKFYLNTGLFGIGYRQRRGNPQPGFIYTYGGGSGGLPPVNNLDNCASRFLKKYERRYMSSVHTRPRLAVLKDNYEAIGSTFETVNNSMWKKTFSQAEQQIRITFNGIYSNTGSYDLGDTNDCLIFSCTSQITKEK